MYRDRKKPPRTPQETQFWRHAAKLKKDGHKTIVHALAWEYPKAYSCLLSLLRDKTPLERISILLWRDHSEAVKNLEKRGYGTFSPSSLRTFREKYFKTGDLPNPEQIRAKGLVEAQLLIAEHAQLGEMIKKFLVLEHRVYITRTGEMLRRDAFDVAEKLVKLQSQLS